MGQGEPDLSEYAKKNELDNYAKTTSLEDYAKKTSLNDYIKTVDIPSNVPLQNDMKKVLGSDVNFQTAIKNLLATDPTFNTSITKFILDNSSKFKGEPGVTQFGALTNAQKAEVITSLYNANKISLVDELTTRDNFKRDIITGLSTIESIRGATGTMGPIGITGATGPIGPSGLTGPAGVGISTGSLSGDNLTFQLTNNTTLGPFNVRGPQGPKGATGEQGPIGPKGDTGAAGGVTEESINRDIKPKTLWCADGSFCELPPGKDAKMTGNLEIAGSLTGVRNISSNFNLRGGDFRPQAVNPGNFAMGFSDAGQGGFADTMIFNTWGDPSGGDVNVIALNKTGNINMRVYRGGQGGTSRFSNYKDVVFQENNGDVQISGELTLPNSHILKGHSDGWIRHHGATGQHDKGFATGNLWADRNLTVNGDMFIKGRNILAELDNLRRDVNRSIKQDETIALQSNQSNKFITAWGNDSANENDDWRKVSIRRA